MRKIRVAKSAGGQVWRGLQPDSHPENANLNREIKTVLQMG